LVFCALFFRTSRTAAVDGALAARTTSVVDPTSNAADRGGGSGGGGGANSNGGGGADDGGGDSGGVGTDDPGTGTGTGTSGGNSTDPACAPFLPLVQEIMGSLFGGLCGDEARAATRLAFHDAGTFSLALAATGAPNGGADGSMLIDPDEPNRSENNGLQTIVTLLRAISLSFPDIAKADVLQLAGALSVQVCPGGPQISPLFMGRKDATNVAPTGLLPDPSQAVPFLQARFEDMGLTVDNMVALIGAHTTAKQMFVDAEFAGDAMDTSVDVWDVGFYSNALAQATVNDTFFAENGVFILESDLQMALNSATSSRFGQFASNQNTWTSHYSQAHSAMSVLGQDTNTLVQCDEILPAAIVLADIVDPKTGVVDQTLMQAEIKDKFGQFLGKKKHRKYKY